MRELSPHGCAKYRKFFSDFLPRMDRDTIMKRRMGKGRKYKVFSGCGGGCERGQGAEAGAEIAEKPRFMRRLYGIQERVEDKMRVTEMIMALRSGDAGAVLAAAEAAADALEVMEERLAIMGEVLTAKEWEATETEARQRVRERSGGK